jgi:hypothetical protein
VVGVGDGGTAAIGELFVVALFSKVRITRETAALLPVAGVRVFAAE